MAEMSSVSYCPNCREDQAREVFIDRLRQYLQQSLKEVSLSVGIAETGPYEYMEPMALIHLADERMYAYKRSRKQNTTAETGGDPETEDTVKSSELD